MTRRRRKFVLPMTLFVLGLTAALTVSLAAQEIQLPEPFATPSVINFLNVVDRPEGAVPKVPAGFSIELYAEDLPGARNMLQATNGDVLVGLRKPGRPGTRPCETPTA